MNKNICLGGSVSAATLPAVIGSGNPASSNGSSLAIVNGQLYLNPVLGNAACFQVAGFPEPAVPGIAGSVTVTTLDGFGNLATNYTGTVALSSSDGAATLPVSHTFTGADAGVYTFNGVKLNTVGNKWTITATDASNGLTGGQTGIQVAVPTVTWNNITSGNWSDNTSWTPNVTLPVGGSNNATIQFSPGAADNSTNDLAGVFAFNQMVMGTSQSITLYAAGGSGLLFTNNIVGWPPVLTNTSSGALTINSAVTLGGSLTLGGASGSITIKSNLAQSVAGTALIKTGGNTLTLAYNKTNIFSGGLYIQAGTVIAGGAAGDLGTGPIYLGATNGTANATLTCSLTGNATEYPNPIIVRAGSMGALTISSGNANANGGCVYPGSVTLSNNLTLNTGGNSAGRVTQLSGNISGAGNILINNTGFNNVTLWSHH